MTSKTTDIEDIREDLARLRSDVRALMKNGAKDGSDAARDVASGIARQASRIVDDLEDAARRTYDKAADTVSDNARHYTRIVEKAISEHPFSAATIALAAGVLVSRFLDRPDR
jgi:ElaB/YqjD/DUF883 family membrane-anchored ribosome-binding protein